MVNKEKITELLKGDVQNQAIAVAMMRCSCSLGESVDMLQSIGEGQIITARMPARWMLTVIFSIYAIPWSMRKSVGVKGIDWEDVMNWTAKSPKKRPARNEFRKKLCRQNVLDYFKDSYGHATNIPIDRWRITGLGDE
jgi:hypothetical protein